MGLGGLSRLVWAAIVLLALIYPGCDTAAADSRAEWKTLNAQALQASQRGEGDVAVSLASRALTLARAQFGPQDPDTLTSMNNLGLALQSQGRYGEAELLYRETLDLLRQVRGSNHRHTLTSMDNLAGVLLRQGRYGEAE